MSVEEFIQNVLVNFWQLIDDKYIFTIFEIAILGILLYGLFHEGRRPSVVVTRGDESWNYFYLTYGIISVLISEVVMGSSAFPHHKVIFILFNLLAALYLFFFNSWFRNKIIGIISQSKSKKEF